MAFAPVSALTVDGLNKFLSMTYHHLISCAIYTFAELGLADRLIHAAPDRGLTIEEMTSDMEEQWNNDLLYRVLRACVSNGIVQLVNDEKHFILTPFGRMMTSDHPAHVSDHIRYVFGGIFTGASQHLPDLVRNKGTGTGIARISGGLDLYTLMGQSSQKELLSLFSGCMTTYSTQTGTKLVTGVDFGRFKTMVDVGGNRGTFLAQILHHHFKIEHGIVFDLSHIINQFNNGEEFTSREISKDKWSFISGDMFLSSTIPVADAYILRFILHDFDDQKCLEILSSIRQASEKGKSSPTTLFIVEHIIFSGEAISNWQSHGIDIAMAVVFDNAHERTLDEYKQLLKQTGFQFQKLYPIQAPHSIIEAVLIPQTKNSPTESKT